jgi:hypothetical protein
MQDKVTTDVVAISKEEYEALKERSKFLTTLEKLGVDSWVGYSVACEVKK